MLTLAELNQKVCHNDFRVVAYRHNGDLAVNVGFGNDVDAAKSKYHELVRGEPRPEINRVVLFNFNEPIMAHPLSEEIPA